MDQSLRIESSDPKKSIREKVRLAALAVAAEEARRASLKEGKAETSKNKEKAA